MLNNYAKIIMLTLVVTVLTLAFDISLRFGSPTLDKKYYFYAVKITTHLIQTLMLKKTILSLLTGKKDDREENVTVESAS